MADLQVTSLTIEELLRKLKSCEWQIPEFQREFVWSVGDVISLVNSILCARPIGMATIWEQPDDTALKLGPLSLSDQDDASGEIVLKNFNDHLENPRKTYAVLDGLQRCTAIALAFGGFRTKHDDFRTSGRYYLNVAALDPSEEIVFRKESEVIATNFDKDGTCISQGYFPLSSNIPNESFMGQWLRYVQAIRDPAFYPEGRMPSKEELERRDNILKKAFEGISHTKLAVYIVPDTYSLSDICEIFERLNTTGTKVSTVDLIHSWLYADTAIEIAGPFLLRDWINDFGQKEGAIGWADTSDRPELMLQMATACYIALEEKCPPRKIGRASTSTITSVKAGDLLATPTDHWKLMRENELLLATYLRDFQLVVAGGLFPWKFCPYPVVSSIYIALRIHAHFDSPETHRWGLDELASLFKAFFWRNALTTRYDQGFLTQHGADLKELKRLLSERQNYDTGSKWAKAIEPELAKLIGRPLPSRNDLVEYVTNGRRSGAIQKALFLPMLASADKDLLDASVSICYPNEAAGVQLHHVYPRDWCRNNKTGNLATILDERKSGRDWVNSVANLMPLSRQSNNIWKAKIPGQVLAERKINFVTSQATLKKAFIDEQCFNSLCRGPDGLLAFWERRADLIIADLCARAEIII